MRDNVEATYPLSPLQKGILFHTQYAPGESPYLTQYQFVLEGTLNIEALESALQAVVNRHTALRTAFIFESNGEPVQVVARRVKVPVKKYDLRSLSDSAQNARLAQYLEEDVQRGCDLTSAPLMRLALFKLSYTKHKIIWDIHHIIVDGWSMPIILKEVFTYYAAFCQGQELRLKEAQPYKHYIDWLEQQDFAKAEAYWRRTLAGITAPTSPGFARSTSEISNGSGYTAVSERRLSLDLTNKLRAVCREQFLTPGTLAHGIWAILLSAYSDQRSVLFGSVVSGRPATLRDVGSMVGLFINSLPLRVDVDNEKPVNIWLRELQEQQADMREYSYSDLSQVQRLSEIASPLPLFETILIFENYPTKPSLEAENGAAIFQEVAGVKLVSADGFDRPAYPLCIVVGPGRCLSLMAIYDNRRFDRIVIEQVLGHFENVLEAISQNPKQRIGELRLLSEEEKRQALFSWNNTQRKFQRNESLSELFERQAQLWPEAVAVVCGSEQLRYGELEQRANQLAHYLRKQGAGPGTMVGLCLEQSLELVVGLLGIVKAGCTYVPLDPQYPRQRLEYVLRDAQVKVVLTQSGVPWPELPEVQWLALDQEWETIAQESVTPVPLVREPQQLDHLVLCDLHVGDDGEAERSGDRRSSVAELSAVGAGAVCAGRAVELWGVYVGGLRPDGDVNLSAVAEWRADGALPAGRGGDGGGAAGERGRGAEADAESSVAVGGRGAWREPVAAIDLGGEALSVRLAQAVVESFGGALELYNEYGPTEATVGCMVHRTRPAQRAGRAYQSGAR